jgi:hypothetical protein
MNTPENSVQTLERYAGKAVTAAAYGCAAYGLLSPVKDVKRRATKAERDSEAEESRFDAELYVDDTADLREIVDDASKLTIADEDAYVASSGLVVYKLEAHIKWGSFMIGEMDRRDVVLKAECEKCLGWSRDMLRVWKMINTVRNRQAKAVEDQELVDKGEKDPFWVCYENMEPHVDRFFKWSIGGLLSIPVIMLVLMMFLSMFMGHDEVKRTVIGSADGLCDTLGTWGLGLVVGMISLAFVIRKAVKEQQFGDGSIEVERKEPTTPGTSPPPWVMVVWLFAVGLLFIMVASLIW